MTIISTTNQTTSVTSFGSVQSFVDGSPVLDRIPLNEDGQEGVVGRGLPPGDFAVTAAYHDDTAPIADFTDSQGGLTQHVVRPAAPAPPAPPPSAPPPTAQPPTAQAAIVSLLGGGHAKATAKGRKISVDPGEQAICPPEVRRVPRSSTRPRVGNGAPTTLKPTTTIRLPKPTNP